MLNVTQCMRSYFETSEFDTGKFLKPFLMSDIGTFVKIKLGCFPIATMYYSNSLNIIQIYPHSLQATHKLDLGFTQQLKDVTQALLKMLLTFR